tara:strand:+ start:13915 stop:15012 length:1098 start_codon:yes stop_codon:yes gene_type:complete
MQDQAAEKAAHAAMQKLARPFPAMGMLAVRQNGVKTSFANTPHGLNQLASWAIYEADQQAKRDEAEIARVISTLENTVQELHVQVEQVAMSTDRHVIKMMEQQKTAHQAEMQVKERAYQAEIQLLKEKLTRQVSVPSTSAVAMPSPAILAEPEQGKGEKKSPPMAAILIPDDPEENGRVELLNPNVLAFHDACFGIGPINAAGEKTDSEDEDIFQPKKKVKRTVDTSSEPQSLGYQVPWGTKVAVPMAGGMVTTEVVGSMKSESMAATSGTHDATLDELAREISAFWKGFDLFKRQQQSQERRELQAQGQKVTENKIKIACEKKWKKLDEKDRQLWAKGSAEREMAYEGWMAANGVSAKGKDPAK